MRRKSPAMVKLELTETYVHCRLPMILKYEQDKCRSFKTRFDLLCFLRNLVQEI